MTDAAIPIEDPSKLAILLDIDGTILDIAPTPREVFVPHSLRETLNRLLQRAGGAVAFVSGRPVSEIDLIFSPLQLPAIGGHGAELRLAAGEQAAPPRLPPLDPTIKRQFAAIAEAGPGIIPGGQGLFAGPALPPRSRQRTHRARKRQPTLPPQSEAASSCCRASSLSRSSKRA